jgi:hypothetical protein
VPYDVAKLLSGGLDLEMFLKIGFFPELILTVQRYFKAVLLFVAEISQLYAIDI